MFVVTILSHNLVAAAFCLVVLFTGVATATVGDPAFFNPWSLPFVLGASPQTLLNQGLDPALVPRGWAVFLAFSAGSLAAAYWLFEKTSAD